MENLERDCINTIKFLSLDSISEADSGHPGICLGFAEAIYALFKNCVYFDVKKPRWVARDKFILSAGHGSAMLYSMLHLLGYDIKISDLRRFRSISSKTPGHPEYNLDLGIEVTTGPLGQGLVNAVGMAIEAKHLETLFNKHDLTLFDSKIYTVVGDGGLQEGISFEALSLASHLGLNNLVVIHDDNSITLDGKISLSSSENVLERMKVLGFETHSVNGNELHSLEKTLKEIKKSQKPVYIACKTKIGRGSKEEGSHKVHGKPISKDEILQMKMKEGMSTDRFHVKEEVYTQFHSFSKKGEGKRLKFEEDLKIYKQKYPNEFKVLDSLLNGKYNELPPIEYKREYSEYSTREASKQFVLDVFMKDNPSFFCGAADVSSSCLVTYNGAEDFQKNSYQGRNIRYGIREHAMGAIMNGISAGGVFRAMGGCFLVFSDYMRPSIRLAALSRIPSIFVFTHDSVFLGEDGPTHQPIEHIASLRAIPNLFVYRPCDANETIECWKEIVKNKEPSALILSRQKVPTLPIKQNLYKNVSKGAYFIYKDPYAKVILVASGSEVSLVLEVAEELEVRRMPCSVVSVPCIELFEQQSESYKEEVLKNNVLKIGVEAGSSMGLSLYCQKIIGIDRFGESGTENEIREHFGFNKERLAVKIMETVFKNVDFE